MNSIDSINDLQLISEKFSELGIKHAFVGGATIAVYLGSMGVTEGRPTDDIDCVVDPPSLSAYYSMEESLRKAGFKNETRGPRCRWNYQNIVVDIMPASEKISGMPSKWFAEGLKHSKIQELSSGKSVPVFSVAYLLATKFEARKDRGKDLRLSTDIEDILNLLDGYPKAFADIQESDSTIKQFLIHQFRDLIQNTEFEELVYGQMSGPQSKDKASRILREIETFISEY